MYVYSSHVYTWWAGHLTARSDVYSFGVVLLELLTGRKSIDKSRPSREQSLVDWALPKLNDKRRLLQIIDPKLEGQYSVRAAHKACSLAFYCLSHNPKARPLMSDVVETLEPLQGSGGSDGSSQSSSLPDYRARRRLTGNSVHFRAIPNPKCSPAVPACRVRWWWCLNCCWNRFSCILQGLNHGWCGCMCAPVLWCCVRVFCFYFWVLASVSMCKFDLHTAACKAL